MSRDIIFHWHGICVNNLLLAELPQFVYKHRMLFYDLFRLLWPSSGKIFTLTLYFPAIFPHTGQCLHLCGGGVRIIY
jgi:hypothetical protein